MSRAVKMFSGILKYMGETGERLDDSGRIEIAQKLLHQVCGHFNLSGCATNCFPSTTSDNGHFECRV